MIKDRIAQQFSRAASSYDEAADVQYDIAQATLALVEEPVKSMIDIGCGTGRISQQLLEHADHVLGADLSAGMIKFAKTTHKSSRLSWLNADVEKLPLEDELFDGAFSSMALQWCKPIDKAFSEIYRVLRPNTQASLSLMCHGSFTELDGAWAAIGESTRTNNFLHHKHIVDVAKAVGFTVHDTSCRFVTSHDNIFDLLGSIKAIGAHTSMSSQNSPRPLSKRTLLALENGYRQQNNVEGKLPLTYQVSMLRLIKE